MNSELMNNQEKMWIQRFILGGADSKEARAMAKAKVAQDIVLIERNKTMVKTYWVDEMQCSVTIPE